MKKRFFISHFDGDKRIADLIAGSLRRVSLTQIDPWYSSDDSPGKGIKPGGIWFNEIVNKINESSALIAILTPNSINRPWIYFECGIAQALENCEVIPVCIGISRDNIPTPLSLYQVYQLSDINSFRDFLGKLLTKYEVIFDEEMAQPILERAISEIGQIKFEETEVNPKLREVIQDLKGYFDKRFIEVLEKPSISIVNSTINDELWIRQDYEKTEVSYTVTFKINLKDFQNEQFLEIDKESTVGDITTELYFLMSKFIQPYTYLETWAIKNMETDNLIVIKEIMDLVPARFVFRPNETYEVISLEKPYSILDSSDRKYSI